MWYVVKAVTALLITHTEVTGRSRGRTERSHISTFHISSFPAQLNGREKAAISVAQLTASHLSSLLTSVILPGPDYFAHLLLALLK